MSTSRCVECGCVVEGEVNGIPLSICCRNCCTRDKGASRQSSYDRGVFISKSRAKRFCKNCPKKLDILQFSTKQENGNIMYLYILKEVEMLPRLSPQRLQEEWRKRAEEERLKAEEAARQLQQEVAMRKLEVETLTGTEIAEMNPTLRGFMLKDYFDPKPTVSSDAVRRRCRVFDRARDIYAECIGAHPQAVFDFCLEYPEGGPKEFQELKEKMRTVFHLEGARILYNLPVKERHSLTSTSLADVYAEFELRDAMAITHGHLEKLVGAETASTIMVHPACQQRLEVGGFEITVAEKLTEFWKEKDDAERRTKRVTEALEKKGYSLRDDCEFCDQYIQGNIDCDVEEVVAVVALYEELQNSDFCPHGERGIAGHEEFRFRFYEEQLDFKTSLELAVDSAMDAMLSGGSCWDSTDSFDFHHGLIYDSEDDVFLDYDDILIDPYMIF